MKAKRGSKFTIPETESERIHESSEGGGLLPNHSSLVAGSPLTHRKFAAEPPSFSRNEAIGEIFIEETK